MERRGRRSVGAVLSGITAVLVAATPVLAATTIAVTPSQMGGWAAVSSGTASVAFETGPGTPPAGTGSAELRVGSDGNSAAQLRNKDYAGTLLSQLTSLEYWTFVEQDGSGGQAPYIILNVDANGAAPGGADLLFFEPAYQHASYGVPQQGPVVVGQWQSWNAYVGGWWALSAGTFGPPVITLQQYIAANPNATIVNAPNGLGGVRIVAGFGAPSWDGFIGNVDKFTIGVNGNETTFDFELHLPAPTTKEQCKNGGWKAFTNPAFKNQGQCIQYVNTGK